MEDKDPNCGPKATANNYRRVGVEVERNCLRCVLKHSVPYMWCPIIGRQVRPDHTCDKQTSKNGD